MLRDLIHLLNGFTDLRDAQTLLVAGGTDLAHEIRHTTDASHHFGHRGTRLINQHRALFNALYAGIDQCLDFLGRIGRSSRQRAHLRGHDSKAASLLTGTGRFDGRIQGQDVGLEGDAVNHADDVRDLFGGVVDASHGLDHLAHDFTAFDGHGGSALCQLVGLSGAVGVLLDGGAELLHRGRSFFQGAGLLFGAG